MKGKESVFKALEDGPGTSIELALETGLSKKAVSSYICRLSREGRIRPFGTMERTAGSRGSVAVIWEAVNG